MNIFENGAHPEIDKAIEHEKKINQERVTDDGLENMSDSEISRLCCGTEITKDPTDDFTFKHLMGTEKNKPLSMSFINSVLEYVREEEKATELTFKNTVLNPTRIDGKQCYLDTLSVDQIGRMFIVEMQKKNEGYLPDRLYHYSCRVTVNQLNRGQAYELIQEVIMIVFTDYDIWPDRPGYIFNHIIADANSQIRDFKKVRYVIINLKKFKLSIDELKTPLERWIYFYAKAAGCDSKDKKKISKDDKFFKKAFNEIISYRWSREDQIAYIRSKRSEENNAANVEAEKKKAKEEGIEEGIEKCARNMITLGKDLDDISNSTNLPLGFLTKLKSSMSQERQLESSSMSGERQLEPSSMSRKRKLSEPTNTI
jgi:predicted transposase/invertase (TIGR01784 family)